MHEAKVKIETGEPRYETRDFTARSMVYSALGVVALTAAGLVASWLVMKYFVTVQKLGPPASPFDNTRTLPPPPRLQVAPAENLKEFEKQENEKLSTYGWVEKNPAIVRIPIERAMELLLQKGFPVRDNLVRRTTSAGRRSGQDGRKSEQGKQGT